MDITGADLAREHLLYLSDEQLQEYFRTRSKLTALAQGLKKRLLPRKLFLVTICGNSMTKRSAIITADDSRSACIELFPFLAEHEISRHRHHERPWLREDCPDCRELLDRYAAMLSGATVTCLGWANARTAGGVIYP